MLGRFVANADPRVFLGAFDTDVTVELVSMSKVDENSVGGLCWIGKNREQCERSKGYPLEPGTKVEIDLRAGEELWGVSGTMALVGYSVKAWRGSV